MSDEYGIGRHVANLFVTQTYEGQSDIHCEFDELNLAVLADLVTSVDTWKSDHGNSGVLLMLTKHANGLFFNVAMLDLHLQTKGGEMW